MEYPEKLQDMICRLSETHKKLEAVMELLMFDYFSCADSEDKEISYNIAKELIAILNDYLEESRKWIEGLQEELIPG